MKTAEEIVEELQKELVEALIFRQERVQLDGSWYPTDDTVVNLLESILRWIHGEAERIENGR